MVQSAGNKLPFAVAQIGHAFRNEIKPANGIIRCREFQLAEIQHFYDPKISPKMSISAKTVLPVLTADNQLAGRGVSAVPLVDLVRSGVVSELVGYYLAKTFSFLVEIGIDQSKIRFREHLDHELAHYAISCWDLECLASFGWVECGGFAQRGAYDLRCHSNASSIPLHADRQLDEVKKVRNFCAKINSKKVPKQRRKLIKGVKMALEAMEQNELERIQIELNAGSGVTIEGLELNSGLW